MPFDLFSTAVVLSAVLLVVSGFDYAQRAVRNTFLPVPSTWILMTVYLSLSFWMYAKSPRWSIAGNIALTAGVLNIYIILIGVIWGRIRSGTLKVMFDKRQKICFLLSAVVVGFFFWKDDEFVSYIALQIVALIAYWGTVQKLLHANKYGEPVFLWLAVLLSALIAIYPAYVKNDFYAWIYIGRAAPSTMGVLWLIWNIRKK